MLFHSIHIEEDIHPQLLRGTKQRGKAGENLLWGLCTTPESQT
jgi:hypothetical protein